MRITIKNARFNPKLICWFSKFNEDGSFVLQVQSMGCELQLIGYRTQEERDKDFEMLDKLNK